MVIPLSFAIEYHTRESLSSINPSSSHLKNPKTPTTKKPCGFVQGFLLGGFGPRSLWNLVSVYLYCMGKIPLLNG